MSAAADDFAAGSLIVPMDTTYQDLGMFEAYGLVYELLRQGVPVRWVIKVGKGYSEIDFTATSTDVRTGNAIPAHGYRGGPWVIDAADAAAAMPIVEAWQTKNANTTVHEATVAFTGDVARLLVVAPTIAMMADGNQKIARKYMMAAKIPDSVGDPLWPDTGPDMLDPLELAGPTSDDHGDGALFDEDGDPVYCQFMSMHWGVGDAQANPEVVAEMREFLQHPTHLFAECQAVNAFENLGDRQRRARRRARHLGARQPRPGRGRHGQRHRGAVQRRRLRQHRQARLPRRRQPAERRGGGDDRVRPGRRHRNHRRRDHDHRRECVRRHDRRRKHQRLERDRLEQRRQYRDRQFRQQRERPDHERRLR
ncbi:hypothetical protein [Nannocystis pusilla]|uniref:hypothetical protein n=1 Tax=Nannocystis pusilla TaxID=889268 RepID=UPI003DA4B4F1